MLLRVRWDEEPDVDSMPKSLPGSSIASNKAAPAATRALVYRECSPAPAASAGVGVDVGWTLGHYGLHRTPEGGQAVDDKARMSYHTAGIEYVLSSYGAGS